MGFLPTDAGFALGFGSRRNMRSLRCIYLFYERQLNRSRCRSRLLSATGSEADNAEAQAGKQVRSIRSQSLHPLIKRTFMIALYRTAYSTVRVFLLLIACSVRCSRPVGYRTVLRAVTQTSLRPT